MKKRLMALGMAAIMAAGSMTACGNTTAPAAGGDTGTAATEAPAATDAAATEAAAGSGDAAAPADGEGKVLNIYCWNEEFANRLADHYPGFVKKSDNVTDGGTIGDVTVNFVVTPSKDNAYQNKLDQTLTKNADAAADDRIDLFLVEADYALKYVNTPYTVSITDLGLNVSDFSNQYKYTQDVMTDSDGNLKGVSWQGCPGVLIYNRDIATEVLGSDDPDTVQAAVKDWDAFKATAEEMQANGYLMTATVNDAFRVFSNNMTSPWVDSSNTIKLDKNIETWLQMSKEMVDAKQTTTYDLWSDEWNSGFYPAGQDAKWVDDEGKEHVIASANKLNPFCYFGPAWMINFSMKADDPASLAAQGKWGAVEGPMGFYWGGTWIAAAAGTDNATLIADIMKQLTANEEIMLDIVEDDNDFVNNKPAMETAAKDDAYAFKVLGGQNPLAMFAAGADKIDLSNMSAYDQGITESFQSYMKAYFDGEATYDEALNNFYSDVATKYPELKHE